MLVRRSVVTAVVLAGAAVAGFSMLNAQTAGGGGLEDTSWVLEEINGEALPDLPGGMARAPGIAFGTGGRFSATAGCNMMNGTAELAGAAIRFPGPVASTMMACPPPLDALERAMAAGLAAAEELRLDSGGMVFLDAEGAALMRFSASQP